MSDLLNAAIDSIDHRRASTFMTKHSAIAKLCIRAVKQTIKMEKKAGFMDCPFCLTADQAKPSETPEHSALCPYYDIKKLMKEYDEANS